MPWQKLLLQLFLTRTSLQTRVNVGAPPVIPAAPMPATLLALTAASEHRATAGSTARDHRGASASGARSNDSAASDSRGAAVPVIMPGVESSSPPPLQAANSKRLSAQIEDATAVLDIGNS